MWRHMGMFFIRLYFGIGLFVCYKFHYSIKIITHTEILEPTWDISKQEGDGLCFPTQDYRDHFRNLIWPEPCSDGVVCVIMTSGTLQWMI